MKWFFLEDRMSRDFSDQNEASASLWREFERLQNTRPPVRFNTNPRILLLDPAYNTRGISYQQYMLDPLLMAEVQLEWQYWVRFYLPGDHMKGLPDSWYVNVDFQNFYDAAWFGCPVEYRTNQVPDTTPILTDDRKYVLFDRGIPAPFAGEWTQRALEYIEFFKKREASGWEFLGRPVRFGGYAPFAGSDGVFTAAASLRGATDLCLDLLTDPKYAHELLAYITEALIKRIQAWRKVLGLPEKTDGFWAADDAIELISTDAYEEFVLPLHQRYYDTLATEKNRGMHLCGDAQRHFKRIHEVMKVSQFDTGFPIDFAGLRRTLGNDVLIFGGPPVSMFLEDDPDPIIRKTSDILQSGIFLPGKYVLQEGNNLPPCARLKNCAAVHEMAMKMGK